MVNANTSTDMYVRRGNNVTYTFTIKDSDEAAVDLGSATVMLKITNNLGVDLIDDICTVIGDGSAGQATWIQATTDFASGQSSHVDFSGRRSVNGVEPKIHLRGDLTYTNAGGGGQSFALDVELGCGTDLD